MPKLGGRIGFLTYDGSVEHALERTFVGIGSVTVRWHVLIEAE